MVQLVVFLFQQCCNHNNDIINNNNNNKNNNNDCKFPNPVHGVINYLLNNHKLLLSSIDIAYTLVFLEHLESHEAIYTSLQRESFFIYNAKVHILIFKTLEFRCCFICEFAF